MEFYWTGSFSTPPLFICGRQGTCCLFLCQQLIKEALRIHYGNEALIVNLWMQDHHHHHQSYFTLTWPGYKKHASRPHSANNEGC